MGGEEPGQWLAEGATLDRIGDGLGNTALITATITGDFAVVTLLLITAKT